MNEFIGRIEDAIFNRRLLKKGDSILVAVSGGLDSMVLLNALHSLSPAHGWKLAVAHYNHQLRGAESNADERFVARAVASVSMSRPGGEDLAGSAAPAALHFSDTP